MIGSLQTGCVVRVYFTPTLLKEKQSSFLFDCKAFRLAQQVESHLRPRSKGSDHTFKHIKTLSMNLLSCHEREKQGPPESEKVKRCA